MKRSTKLRKVIKESTLIYRAASSLVLIGSILAIYHSIWWIALPIFVSLNMLQFSFTGFCPMTKIVKALGMKVE
ncbi:DUF2892 domain-containing protein [Candidatus Woesearchaeota archaeon]|nr:DUF2892 domain-containing protein [Candidatus Woesearchaeota archaeon]